MSEEFSDSNVEAAGSKKQRKARVKRPKGSLDKRIDAARKAANVVLAHAGDNPDEVKETYDFMTSFLGLKKS